jgi:hypothetical protein
MPVGFAVTVRLKVPVLGVVHGEAEAQTGVTESQPELDVLTAKGAAAPPPVTLIVWVGGFEPPEAYANVMVVGVAETTGAPATASVTFTVTVVPPVGWMVNTAAYAVDDAVRPVGFAVTVRVVCVVAEIGVAVSQLALLLTVNGIPAEPLALDTTRFCVGGLLPPVV